jgi:2-dehydropantoate 2-reductase
MRFVVYGAGAVGGVVGARLHQQGHDVTLVARGAHLEALRADGLRLVDPDGEVTLRMEAVGGPEEIELGSGTVVLLATKSQDTQAAVDRLARVAPSSTPVVCMQNGVANERVALRSFEPVYGMCIVCPAVHLEPGRVEASAHGISGLFDVGRYPRGSDARAGEISAAFTEARCESIARPDIMRWKYRKLLNNLSNVLDALCGPESRDSDVSRRARDEASACLDAAGIDVATEEEDRERRGEALRWDSAASRSRPGASTWQSLARGAGVETDYLNGEIVLLGRLHGVPTPVNLALVELVHEASRAGAAPGSWSLDDVIQRVDRTECG